MKNLLLLLAIATLGCAGIGSSPPWEVPEDAWPADGLSEEAATAARTAWECARKEGAISRPVLGVIDFSLPSTEPRMWVVDTATGELLFHERVAHGQGSGGNLATSFSNTTDSHQSSLGVFRAAETYHGKHGFSLRLDGLEPGINDRARPRAIVIHGADYATADFVETHGRLGRSWGCPAVRPDVSKALIEALSDGGLLVAYYPDREWLDGSNYLGCGG